MLDIQSFKRALKTKWNQRYLDPINKGNGNCFYTSFLPVMMSCELLLHGNLNLDDVAFLGIEETFTKELIETWPRLNKKKKTTLQLFGVTPTWYNSLIRINNKPIYYRNWSSAGISLISDLLEEDSQFLGFDTYILLRKKLQSKLIFSSITAW